MVNKLVGWVTFLGAVSVLVTASSLWSQKAALERSSHDTISDIIDRINVAGPAFVRGRMGSEPWRAKDEWKKFVGLFDQDFLPDRESIRLSHLAKNPAARDSPVAIFFVEGTLSEKSAVVEIAIADQHLVYWKVRSFDRSLITREELASGCRSAYLIADVEPIITFDPPWIAFPHTKRYSTDWFDTDKRDFIVSLGKSWSQLDESERELYVDANPTPDGWEGWYDGLRGSWTADAICPSLDAA